jgi:hypothetical protein
LSENTFSAANKVGICTQVVLFRPGGHSYFSCFGCDTEPHLIISCYSSVAEVIEEIQRQSELSLMEGRAATVAFPK